MTNYNERLDKVLDDFFTIGTERHISELRQALTSLTKGLVAEAKPETWADPDDTDELMRWQGYVDGIIDFEQNLLKALEEK